LPTEFDRFLARPSVGIGLIPLLKVLLFDTALLVFFDGPFPRLVSLPGGFPVSLLARIVVWLFFAHGTPRKENSMERQPFPIFPGSSAAAGTHVPAECSYLSIISPKEFIIMMKSKLAVGALVVAGLVGSPLAADAKSHKHSKHSSMTTGAHMKSDKGATANPSGQSNRGANTGSSTTGPAATGK
jgi:hypothetical protein